MKAQSLKKLSVRRDRRNRQSGFTLIELMIVVAIILILIGMAVGGYQKSIAHAREASLKQDLFVMRQAIDRFTLDKEAAPQSLQDLVDQHYLGAMPVDPITMQADWHVEYGDFVLSPEQTNTGITNVFSNSGLTSPFDGTPYNTW